MSMFSILSKSALVGALLLGNIAPPTEDFFEDDADFSTVAANLATGWGWFQLNSAKASCADMASQGDCYTVIGTPPPDDPWGGAGGDESSFIEQSDYADDGGSGGGSTPPPPPPPTTDQTRIETCKSNVKAEVLNCKDTFFYYTTGAGMLCGRLTWGQGASFCGYTTGILVNKASNWCDAQGDAKIARECI